MVIVLIIPSSRSLVVLATPISGLVTYLNCNLDPPNMFSLATTHFTKVTGVFILLAASTYPELLHLMNMSFLRPLYFPLLLIPYVRALLLLFLLLLPLFSSPLLNFLSSLSPLSHTVPAYSSPPPTPLPASNSTASTAYPSHLPSSSPHVTDPLPPHL